MKKVLIVHPSLGIGGAEKIIAFLTNVLSNGYETNLLLLKDVPLSLEIENSVNVIVRDCYFASPIISKHIFRGLRSFNNMTRQVEKIIQEINPVLVIAFELRTALSLSILKRKLGVKVLFSERADPYEHSFVWSYLLKKVYRIFDHIVFQTSGAKDYYGNIVENKSTIIPNPAIQRLNNHTNVDIELSAREKYIFSAGRFQKRKGFDLLIAAFAKIHEKQPEYKLRIYGDGQEKANYEKLIEDFGITGYVELLPRLNGVVEYNRNAMLFVLPSRSEGMPNILMEAMALGIPSVACDCSPGGARVISENGRYCLLAQNNNVESLAKELDFALSNLPLMKEMSKEAKNSMKRFDCLIIMNEWKSLIEKLING